MQNKITIAFRFCVYFRFRAFELRLRLLNEYLLRLSRSARGNRGGERKVFAVSGIILVFERCPRDARTAASKGLLQWLSTIMLKQF